jgi:hypothetical protein
MAGKRGQLGTQASEVRSPARLRRDRARRKRQDARWASKSGPVRTRAIAPAIMNAEQMAEKHDLDGLALRNMLRDDPDLTPGHRFRGHYRIDAETEARIMRQPKFQGLRKR